jgi:glutaredoxin
MRPISDSFESRATTLRRLDLGNAKTRRRPRRSSMIEIYGKSGCDYCTKAQKLLSDRDIPYNYIQLGIDITSSEFLEQFPDQKTVPLAVAHGMKVGGYNELVEYIEETSGGYAHDI